jgi:hypothetical protein
VMMNPCSNGFVPCNRYVASRAFATWELCGIADVAT